MLTPHFSDNHLALHLEQVHRGEAGERKEAKDKEHGACGGGCWGRVGRCEAVRDDVDCWH